jgi:hypothetical protein
MNPGNDLAIVLRFLRANAAKFPFVAVLGPAGVSQREDGAIPHDIQSSAVNELSSALRNASSAEHVHFLDVLELRSARSEVVNSRDGVHPDQILNLYILSMVLTLMGVN